MRGLTVIVVEPSSVRYRAALELVAAEAALGGRARLFLQGSAVALLQTEEPLVAEAAALGVTFHACQTGLAETGLVLGTGSGFTAAGPVLMLQTLGEDRLISL